MSRFTDTIAALATPSGTAAIAVLRISGMETERLAREIFGTAPLPRRVRHAAYRDRQGAMIDDVVAVFFQGPKSYTGEDALEISCHGNPFIAQKILEDLLARGCRAAEPGEFTQRAFLNGRMDLSQAEAVMDVIQARSDRALASAQRQLQGALGRRVGAAVESLLAVLAQIEAYIDFPDEDLPAEDRAAVVARIETLAGEVSKILATSHYGEMLRDGIKTVIVGRPNAGKSSLLNRLLGRERALVSAEPGTTRDFIEERIMVGPHCLRLIDTAGLNPAPGVLESLGMEKTRERVEEADLVLVVVDGASLESADFNSFLDDEQIVNGKREVIVVLNKCDLGPMSDGIPGTFGGLTTVRVSAKTGEGVGRLEALIVAAADRYQTEIGEDEVAINARHAAALKEVAGGLAAALEHLGTGASPELVASELRTALAELGQIAGRVDNERMLDHLFAGFCIGK